MHNTKTLIFSTNFFSKGWGSIVYLCVTSKRKTTRHSRHWHEKEKQILTGDQGHRNDIKNGQRVSLHTLPQLQYFLFSPPHIFLFNLMTAHKRHIGFCPNYTGQSFSKSQRAFIPEKYDTYCRLLKKNSLALPTYLIGHEK